VVPEAGVALVPAVVPAEAAAQAAQAAQAVELGRPVNPENG